MRPEAAGRSAGQQGIRHRAPQRWYLILLSFCSRKAVLVDLSSMKTLLNMYGYPSPCRLALHGRDLGRGAEAAGGRDTEGAEDQVVGEDARRRFLQGCSRRRQRATLPRPARRRLHRPGGRHGRLHHHRYIRIRLETKKTCCRRKCKITLNILSFSIEEPKESMVYLQESLLHEMWEEFKFAINWRAGDTKPIKAESTR